MWPSSTARKRLETVQPRLMFQSLKRDVAFFHMKISRSGFVLVMFQSLKRDVAFFHYGIYRVLKYLFDVSIAQARCGLLPLPIEYGSKSGVHVVSIAQARCGLLPLGKNVAAEAMHKPEFQSLKRDVAFFHPPMIPPCATGLIAVSIAQARCGLLPHQKLRPDNCWPQWFKSLKRDVAFFHGMGPAF